MIVKRVIPNPFPDSKSLTDVRLEEAEKPLGRDHSRAWLLGREGVAMSSRTAFLSKLIGFYAIAIAIALIVNKEMMAATVTGLFKDPSIVLVYAVMALGIGLAIVIGHNVWSGAAAIIVTIIGWLSLFKGLVLLLLPANAQAAYFLGIHYDQYFYVYAAVTLVIGAYLVYQGFRSSAIR
jgi:hypothetical protein